ncbi:phosphoribosylglycinamide formyltransferase [Arenibacter amylolyticus]|uniref:phosphoribosylglycinamide formyltransferase n=1 Tax=Arenibacter amylolyticus TaxID=1406873 RepID=UPI000A3CC541|nr:phosphoribosylglycinamide formyltransferase [Arenibacter amylolyticus]
MKTIVLFASGSGSNVENIIEYFKDSTEVQVKCVLSNNRKAMVFERCNRLHISALYFNRTSFYKSDCVLDVLRSLNPDLIVLAGFLWKIPENLIQNFPNKIVNIHPALLPKYGGKGMYGMHVHQAVKENKETETGITIHYVNENYDEGAIIAQESVSLDATDTPETIAEKVHQLEYEHFPKVIHKIIREL